ncbi:MAG: hypothetical protein AB7Q81_06845 [Gammaproteobacteria bacterium]
MVTTGGLLLTGLAVVLVVLVRVLARERTAHEARAAALARYLGVPRQHLPRAGGQAGIVVDGAALTCHCRPGDRRRRSHFELRLPVRHAVELEVRSERQAERIGKQLGLVNEVQTGDARFDARCFVDTAQVDFARRYLADAARREQLLALLEGGFDVVRFDCDGIAAVVYEPGLARPDAARLPVTALSAALQALARDLPRGGALVDQRRAWRQRLTVVYTLLGTLAAAALAAAAYVAPRYPVLDGFALVRFSLLAAVPTTLLLGVLLIAALRGHSSSLRHCFAALLLAATASFAGGWAGALAANAGFDRSAPRAHVVPVIAQHTRGGRHGTTYYVRVSSWRPGRTYEEFAIPPEVYRALRPGRDAMRVVTRAGRFGFEWYVAREPDPGAAHPGTRALPPGDDAALPEFHGD